MCTQGESRIEICEPLNGFISRKVVERLSDVVVAPPRPATTDSDPPAPASIDSVPGDRSDGFSEDGTMSDVGVEVEDDYVLI